MIRALRKPLLALCTLAMFILMWHGYVVLFDVPAQILPTPGAFVERFIHNITMDGFGVHMSTTLYEIAVGFLIGCTAGLAIGYILAKSPLIERMLTPYIVLAQIIPKISIAPLFLLWFGLGPSAKVALVVIGVFFPIMVNTIIGIRSVESNMKDLLYILRASKWQRFISVEVPFSLPSIMAGVKVATTYAITGAVIGEMVGAKAGLGYLVISGSENYDINMILTAVLILSLMGLALYLLVGYLEKKLLHWHESQEVIL